MVASGENKFNNTDAGSSMAHKENGNLDYNVTYSPLPKCVKEESQSGDYQNDCNFDEQVIVVIKPLIILISFYFTEY